jgi:hypothetical protein
MGQVPSLVPSSVKFWLEYEMGEKGYNPQEDWEDFSDFCLENPGECETFDRVHEALSSPDRLSQLFSGKPEEEMREALQDNESFWDKAKGAIVDLYNDITYDGWIPQNEEELLNNAPNITKRFLNQFSNSKIDAETMESVEQLRELGHYGDESTITKCIDIVNENLDLYRLEVENEPKALEEAAEHGNLGNVYNEFNF